MAGGGGAAGPALSIRHQPPGALTRSLTETDNIYFNIIPNFQRRVSALLVEELQVAMMIDNHGDWTAAIRVWV